MNINDLPPADEPLEPELVDMFVEESEDLLPKIEEGFDNWRLQSDEEALKEVMRHLHTVKGSARMTGFSLIGNFIHSLETLMGNFSEKGMPLDDAGNTLVRKGLDILGSMVDRAKADRRLEVDQTTLGLQNMFEQYPDVHTAIETKPIPEEPVTNPDTSTETHQEPKEIPAVEIVTDAPQEAELIEMFVEEAQDLMPKIEEGFETWQQQDDEEALKEIMRHLHTVKGSARMTGFSIIGNYVHSFENMMGHFSEKGMKLEPTGNTLIQKAIDNLNTVIDKIKSDNKLTLDKNTIFLQDLFEKFPNIDPSIFNDQTQNMPAINTPEIIFEEEEDLPHPQMEERIISDIINSIVLPLEADYTLILPITCVAEIAPIADWHEFDHEHEENRWLIGYVEWRDVQVPLLSFEAGCGNPLPEFSTNTHIAILYSTVKKLQKTEKPINYFALVVQGIPKLVRLKENMIRSGNMETSCAFIKAMIDLQNEEGDQVISAIPHLENLERSVVGQIVTHGLLLYDE